MKVFISWSGIASRELAEALHWWLPKVIQGVQPFVSSKDIDKGANWTSKLEDELESTTFGVVCLTPENVSSPWLNFEAGAISSAVDSRVCPVLLGLDKRDVTAPLAQLQLTSLDDEDVLAMMSSMNKAAGAPLTTESLRETVEIWWPKLEERVAAIGVPEGPGEVSPEPAQPELTQSEVLDEILQRVRQIDGWFNISERSRRHEEPARERVAGGVPPRKHLAVVAEADGLNLNDAVLVDGDVILIEFEELPVPIPWNFHTYMSDLAIKAGKVIRLADGHGRLVEFDADGKTDEPPF